MRVSVAVSAEVSPGFCACRLYQAIRSSVSRFLTSSADALRWNDLAVELLRTECVKAAPSSVATFAAYMSIL